MRIFTKQNQLMDASDVNLVMHSLGGSRDAFCQIVTRYQNLLCSIAYSSVGDIKNSEDIAQEAFVEAWKKLDTLHDPEKLKAWLCGILRFKVSHFRRKEDKQPIKDAQALHEHTPDEADNAQIEQAAIDEQQQALMWRVLDEIDETYREPLILFYREQQSIERVAVELDLSQDTVKQRLSRGRKMLKAAMSSFVEQGLSNSKPGVVFTAGVMAAISGIAPPAKAAVLGAGAAKTSTMFSLTSIFTFLAIFSGLISSFFGLRSSLDQSRTQRERKLVIKGVSLFMLITGVYIAGLFGLKYLALGDGGNAGIYALVSQLLVLAFVMGYVIHLSRMFAAMRALRAHERIFEPQAFLRDADQKNAKQREYISRLTLFGVPLVHFQFGAPENDDKPAFGWIAGGSYAYGLLFAWGGVAIAPFSVGIIALGVISIGGVGIGLLSLSTVAIGFIGFGASAVAYKAYASLTSLGWESAFSSGFSIAKEAAIGPIAYGAQVNNEQAIEISNLTLFGQSYHWALALIAVFVIVPAIWHSTKVRQRMR